MDYTEFGKQFTKFYYDAFNGTFDDDWSLTELQREELANLYHENTLLTNQDNELMGVNDIMEYLMKDDLLYEVKHCINFTAQPSIEDTVLITAQGDCFFVNPDGYTENELTPDNPDFHKLHFTEVFLIGQDPETESFVIHNQIFSCQGV